MEKSILAIAVAAILLAGCEKETITEVRVPAPPPVEEPTPDPVPPATVNATVAGASCNRSTCSATWSVDGLEGASYAWTFSGSATPSESTERSVLVGWPLHENLPMDVLGTVIVCSDQERTSCAAPRTVPLTFTVADLPEPACVVDISDRTGGTYLFVATDGEKLIESWSWLASSGATASGSTATFTWTLDGVTITEWARASGVGIGGRSCAVRAEVSVN